MWIDFFAAVFRSQNRSVRVVFYTGFNPRKSARLGSDGATLPGFTLLHEGMHNEQHDRSIVVVVVDETASPQNR